MSTIGPNTRNARIDAGVKVPTNDSATNASTVEHTEMTKASTLSTSTELTAPLPIAENRFLGHQRLQRGGQQRPGDQVAAHVEQVVRRGADGGVQPAR